VRKELKEDGEMNQILRDNLGKVFDSMYMEEVKPDLQKYASIKEEALLTFKQSAVCLNTRFMKFKEFLIKEGFIGKFGHVIDASLEGKFFKTHYRDFSNDRKKIPLVTLTREGFQYLGSLFIRIRNKNPYL
jgi:hypothetical protein